MPVSKKRKPRSSAAKRGPSASAAQPRWGRARLDRLFEVWVHRLETVPGLTSDERIVAAAATTWVGATNPSAVGLNQCVSAAQWIGAALAHVGYKVDVRAVVVTLSEAGELVETLGSPDPVHHEASWSGHVVIHLPGPGIVFDATIGQARAANTQERMFPVLMRQDALKGAIPDDSAVGLKRADGLELEYRFLVSTVDYRTPGIFEQNASIVQKWFDRHGDSFTKAVDALRNLTP